MDLDTPAEPDTAAFELSTMLARYGLGDYKDCLTENGFDSWGTVAEITESDMSELGFKLGDRRKLQRAILEHRSSSASQVEGRVTTIL